MIEYALFLKFAVALVLGALIGLQRERFHKREEISLFGGIRTFILICLLGTLSAFLSDMFHMFYGFIIISGFIMFIIIVYKRRTELTQDMGGVTEITAILTFIIGMICYMGDDLYGRNIQFAIAITILLLIVISTKHLLHEFAKRVDYQEVVTTLKFAVISFIILPLLPNQPFGPYGLFNPYKIWLVVVLLSALSYVGYILNKFLSAKKSIALTGVLGGMTSSTALTSAMSIDSKKNEGLSKAFAGATVTASGITFLRILLIVFVINAAIIPKLLIPMLSMAAVSFLVTWILFRKEKPDRKVAEQQVEFHSPFRFLPALSFGIFFILVLYASKLATVYFSSTGIVVTGIFSGIADVDAISVSMASLSKIGMLNAVSLSLAVIVITCAAIANMLTKLSIAYLFGNRNYAGLVGIGFGFIILTGLIALLFV